MENKIIKFLIILLILCIIGIIVASVYVNNKSKFVKPKIDKSAIDIPENIPEELGYSSAEIKEGYKIGLCSKLILNDENICKIFFTSDSENDVYIKLRIYDIKDNIVVETGLLKPGKCIEEIKLNGVKGNQKIKVKVMSYNPKTYCSEGVAIFNLKVESK